MFAVQASTSGSLRPAVAQLAAASYDHRGAGAVSGSSSLHAALASIHNIAPRSAEPTRESDRPPARHRRDAPSTRHYNATQVAEAALVGVPHDVKGSALYAFVTLTQDAEGQAGDELAKELKLRARADVAAFASPDTFHWAPTGLPKTRSGKIMRRILRKIAAEGADVSGLGDTSTLADPGIVDELIASHAGASK